MGSPIFVKLCTTTRLRIVMIDGLSLVVFYLQRGQICHIPYTAQMASNTAYCTTVHTRDTVAVAWISLAGSDVTPVGKQQEFNMSLLPSSISVIGVSSREANQNHYHAPE